MADPGPLESPWLKSQVETHLVFRFIARRITLFWIILVVAAAIIPFDIFSSGSLHIHSFELVTLFGFTAFVMRKFSRYAQAAVSWIAFKVVLAFVALLSMTLGTFLSLTQGRSDALPNFLIGIIWIPSLEFLPRFTPGQRYITLLRIAASIPVVWMGVASGNWH